MIGDCAHSSSDLFRQQMHTELNDVSKIADPDLDANCFARADCQMLHRNSLNFWRRC
jgi:hypothetical protein